jgi:hypothetical protein
MHWPANARSSISCIKFDPIDSHTVSLITPSPVRRFNVYCQGVYQRL